MAVLLKAMCGAIRWGSGVCGPLQADLTCGSAAVEQCHNLPCHWLPQQGDPLVSRVPEPLPAELSLSAGLTFPSLSGGCKSGYATLTSPYNF